MRANIFIFGSLITATIFGLFGQSIAYFMNDHIVKTAPIYYLTGLTIASYTFYLLPIIYVIFKRKQLKFGTLIYFWYRYSYFNLVFIRFGHVVGVISRSLSLFANKKDLPLFVYI